MFTVMRDPVCLPSSKTILDRATIKSHLLSDSKDPFNRAPLTIEEVIPGKEKIVYIWAALTNNFFCIVPELKARIEAFLIERRTKKASSMHEELSKEMDTSQ